MLGSGNAEAARKDIVQALNAPGPAISEEWLRHLHASHIERYLSDNNRIGTTAAIMVPISLASFPAFFSVADRTVLHALSFGGFSSFVMLLWNVIAEKHRMFQSRLLYIASGIESFTLGADRFNAIRAATLMQSPKALLSVRAARLMLLTSTVALWGITILLISLDD